MVKAGITTIRGSVTSMRIFVTSGTKDHSAMASTGGTGRCSGARGHMKLQYRNPKGTELGFPCELE